jgi:hypothetical protein
VFRAIFTFQEEASLPKVPWFVIFNFGLVKYNEMLIIVWLSCRCGNVFCDEDAPRVDASECLHESLQQAYQGVMKVWNV